MYNENKGFPYKAQPSVPIELITDEYYIVKDNSGKTTTKLPKDLTAEDINVLAQGGKSSTGTTYYKENPGAFSKMKLDVNTGKVTITAPESAFKNEAFSKQVDDVAKAISQNYRINQDHKYALLNNTEETKTSEEWIEDFNKDLPQMVEQAIAIEKIKDDTRKADGVELSDKDAIIMNSVALEYNDKNGQTVKLKDDTMQALPEKAKALNVFKELEGWDENSHMVSWGNLKKQWDREKNSDEDILAVFDLVDDYFKKKDFSNPTEYAEMSALRQFIYGKDPDVGFWRNVAETTGEAILGVITGAAAFDVSVFNAIETIANIPSGGKQFTYVKDTLAPELEKWVEDRRSTTAKLSDARAGWGSVTNTLTPIAMELAVSVWAGKIATKGVVGASNRIINGVVNKYVKSAESLANVANVLARTGNAVELADHSTKIAESLYVGTEVSLKLMSAAQAAKVISTSFKVTTAILKVGTVAAKGADILAQAVVDITLSDPKLFRTLMESGDDESKSYALQQLTANAAGEIAGVAIGRGIMKFGQSDLGLILQAKTAPKASFIKSRVGQAADNIKTWLHHGNEDWLKDKTDKIREAAEKASGEGTWSRYLSNRAGKYERKLQNLTERRILRAANSKISEMSGYITSSDTWEEALEKAREVKGKMADTLAEANNLIDDMYKRDVSSIVARFYIDNPDLDGARKAYVEKLSKVIKAEDAAGLGSKTRRSIELTQEVATSGKKLGKTERVTFGIISQETNEYILGQYRLERAKAVASLSKIPEDVRGAKKEIEYYTEAINKFREGHSQELVDAADELLVEGRRLSGFTQDLRVKEGVLSGERLESWRTSGFFDEGYMRTQKQNEWLRWRKGGGQLKISDPGGIESYKWGFSGDAPEPFQDISLVLFDDINEVARQTNRLHMVDMLKDLGFKVNTVVEGDKTRIVAEASDKVQKVAIETVDRNTRNLISANADSRLYNSFFDKKGANWFVQQANMEAVSSGGKLARTKARTNPRLTKAYKAKYLNDAPITEVNGILADNGDTLFRNATRSDERFWEFRKGLDAQSRKMLDERMLAGVGRNYNIPYVPKAAKTEATNIARRQSAIWNSKLAAAELSDTGKISSSDLKKIYTVSNFRANSDIDQAFIDTLKRQYTLSKYGNTNDVVNTITAAKYREDVFRAETLYKENLEKLAAIRKKYDLPEFNQNVADDIEDFIEEAITANYDSAELKDVAKALADGTAGVDDLVEYTTLQSLYKNRRDLKNKFYSMASDRYNQALTANINTKYAGKENAKIRKAKIAGVSRMADSWANETSEMLITRIEERYAETTRRLMQQGSGLVTEEAKRSMFDRIAELNKEISKNVKADSVIKTYGAYGYEEYVEVSPTVADMFTSMPRPMRRGPFGELQQQFVRIFRFGTTGGLVPGSLVNQAFRDVGNAMVMGDAVKTNTRVEAELAELFGERFAKEYQETIPDVYATLLKKSEETGESVNKLIAQREMKLGELNVASELERNIYTFGQEAKYAKNAEGIYDTNTWERITDKLDYWQNKAERLNTAREVYLRKRVYNNALLDSMKQGLSVQQSRKVAEFLQSEATTNFTRQSYHFANLTKTVPYLGSAINGQKSFWRLLAWDPIGVSTRIIGGYVVPVIALTNMSLSNPEDRRIYEQIPEYEKAEHITFVINGQIMSIPVPQEISNFVTPVQHLIETMAGASDHSFSDLLLNDLLGAYPIELDGFMNIDADELLEGDIWSRNLLPGAAKIASSLMTPLEKAGFIMATGYDPYTMKPISRTNTMLDYDTGEEIPMNTQAGALARMMGQWLDGFMSATMAEKVLRNLIGQGNVLLADGLVNLGSAIVDPNKNIVNGLADTAQEYIENATDRISVKRYGEEVNLAWNRAVGRLWDEKRELLNDKKYNDDLKALQSAGLSDDARNTILSRVRTRQQEFMQHVLDVSNNLVEKYDGTFDRNKFAAVISLMNLSSDDPGQLPENSYDKYLSTQRKQLNRAAAVETMARMGFRSSNDATAFGYYAEDQNGDIVVQYNSPLNILNYNETTKWQDEVSFADIRRLVIDEGLYEAKQALDNQINAIYKNKKVSKQDRANIEKMQIEWNYKVAETIAPVLAKMTPDAAVNNKKVKDYLYTYIYVPGSFEVNNKGRYVTLGDNGNKKAAYYDKWMEKLFGMKSKYD